AGGGRDGRRARLGRGACGRRDGRMARGGGGGGLRPLARNGMRPRLMGIVNASPDSFSDPGERAVDQLVSDGLAQVEAGADLIDVGGESGVTHTGPVSPEDELERVLPVVEQ